MSSAADLDQTVHTSPVRLIPRAQQHSVTPLEIHKPKPGHSVQPNITSLSVEDQLAQMIVENQRLQQQLHEQTTQCQHLQDTVAAYETELAEMDDKLMQRNDTILALEQKNANLVQLTDALDSNYKQMLASQDMDRDRERSTSPRRMSKRQSSQGLEPRVARRLKEAQAAIVDDYKRQIHSLEQALSDAKHRAQTIALTNTNLQLQNEHLQQRIALYEVLSPQTSPLAKSPQTPRSPLSPHPASHQPQELDTTFAQAEIKSGLVHARKKIARLTQKIEETVGYAQEQEQRIEHLETYEAQLLELVSLSHPQALAEKVRELKQMHAIDVANKESELPWLDIDFYLQQPGFVHQEAWQDLVSRVKELKRVCNNQDSARLRIVGALKELAAATTPPTPQHGERLFAILDKLSYANLPAPLVDALDQLLLTERELAKVCAKSSHHQNAVDQLTQKLEQRRKKLLPIAP
eukprot:m.145391 g.145391  ORF g.145391 m.145391 type:complete len:464 (-) comp14142_c0_seq6:1354-2745(-)